MPAVLSCSETALEPGRTRDRTKHVQEPLLPEVSEPQRWMPAGRGRALPEDGSGREGKGHAHRQGQGAGQGLHPFDLRILHCWLEREREREIERKINDFSQQVRGPHPEATFG